MKPPPDRLQAYLFVASLSALVIQAAVFVAILLLHVPERAFESSAFRVAVLAATGCALVVVRRQARRATREAGSRNRSPARLRAACKACASKRADRANFSHPPAVRASRD